MAKRKKHETDILKHLKRKREIVACSCTDIEEECKAERERMLKLFQKKNKDDYIDIRSHSEIYEDFKTYFARQESDK